MPCDKGKNENNQKKKRKGFHQQIKGYVSVRKIGGVPHAFCTRP